MNTKCKADVSLEICLLHVSCPHLDEMMWNSTLISMYPELGIRPEMTSWSCEAVSYCTMVDGWSVIVSIPRMNVPQMLLKTFTRRIDLDQLKDCLLLCSSMFSFTPFSLEEGAVMRSLRRFQILLSDLL